LFDQRIASFVKTLEDYRLNAVLNKVLPGFGQDKKRSSSRQTGVKPMK
jgi:hypothetical protein